MRSTAYSHYAIRGVVRYYGWLPETVHRHGDAFTGNLDLRRNADVSRWTVLPHVRLANLPTYDAKGKVNMTPRNDLKIDPASVEAFLKRYGVLHRENVSHSVYKTDAGSFITQMDKSKGRGPQLIEAKEVRPGFQFKEGIGAFSNAQYLLRKVWAGDSHILAEEFNDGTMHFAFKLASFDILQDYSAHRSGEVLLETSDLWHYMRYLFLIDYAECRTAVCERKDCLTPYFVQQRKGQRYCSHECAVLENVRRFRSKERAK